MSTVVATPPAKCPGQSTRRPGEQPNRRRSGTGGPWAHWRLGEKDKARDWYDRAAQWMDKNQRTDEELRRFRAEAAELLGVTDKKD